MNKPIESKPFFVIGEVVILQSVLLPYLNGERTILFILQEGEDLPCCPITGAQVGNQTDGLSHILDDGHVDEDGLCVFWNQSALRKRHQPGEYSFEDLKTILYLPQSRDEIARLERGMQV